MNWVGLGLISAFSLASADAYTKRFLGDRSPRELVLVRFTVTALLLLPLLVARPPGPLPTAFWGWVAAAIPLEVAAMALYMRAIQVSPLALTVPYLAFTPVFASLIGWLLLGERVSIRGAAGIGLVVAGAYLLNAFRGRGPRGWRAVLEPLKAVGREPGSRWMLLAAFIYSVTSVLGKGALAYSDPLSFGPLYFAVLGAACLGYFLLVDRPAVIRLIRRPGHPLAVGALMAAMVLSHFAAIAQVQVAYMIAVKRTSLLFGIGYGALLFRERELPRHLAAGAVMLAGVVLIVG